MFTHMYAEFTWVYIHTYMYGRRVYLCECICLHIYTPSLQVVYVFACRQTEFTCVCVCVYVYTYMYEKTLCVHAECVHTNTGIHVGVCILFTGFFLYVCVGIHISICIHERHHGCIQIHCVRIGIHVYVSVFVCVCIYTHVYIYIWKDNVCTYEFTYVCVYTCIFTPTSNVGA